MRDSCYPGLNLEPILISGVRLTTSVLHLHMLLHIITQPFPITVQELVSLGFLVKLNLCSFGFCTDLVFRGWFIIVIVIV